ncbi:glycoside hydrolase family 3 N-terminal domain-containing protein [uncultured Paludibaculum sp.]|uniref:glycoside hydrolase family 3 protein n=1 Tax=uncultured Paludibaculum sp. TaxID=1765020 RepID=UPI002AAA7F49|nr:glycoside hydrolase family 3 N-terminal domain-containing protein [uncultured Paludibaculum sp.]
MQYPKLSSIVAVCTAAASVVFLSLLGAAAPPKSKALSSYDPQVKELLARMTLDEKIGQMTQPDQEALKDEADIENLFLGSLLSGGSSDPKEGNSLEAWTNLYDRYQARSLKTRLAIPLLYGVDALHGHNNVIGAVVFPQNIGLGCTRNPALVEKIARVTAEEVRATGIQWTFAPCVTVPQDIRWGRTYEGFSDDPALVKKLGEAAVRGLQGADLSNPLSVLACAKHYVGDGGTTLGTGMAGKSPLDQGDTRVDEATLRRLHLQGYFTTIAAGAGTVMPSYSSWNGVKCSASKQLMTDILKGELGFQGFLISDYNAIDQITPDYKKAIEISINAGMDMVMVTARYREYIKDLKELVEEGRVPMARIDDAVTRILRVKFAMGLMDKSRSQLADRTLQKGFGSAEHRQVAREAVRQSLVLLKNDKKTLPLKKTVARIHIAGKNADDIGNQCGGWTIDWQGKSGNITTGGTTIRAAIQAAVSPDTKVTYSVDGSGAQGATVGVVVVGEKPYAEMMGDRKTLAMDKEDVDAVNTMKAAGIPVVVVLVSGRPLIINDVLAQADAFVAAWLPGTEGQGVSDVLFGDFKPTGKLSFAWPRSDDQLPLGTATKADVLFKNGFGLKY